MSVFAHFLAIALFAGGVAPPPASAQPAQTQAPAQRGKLIVTVADPSGAVIPEATVTLIGLDETMREQPRDVGGVREDCPCDAAEHDLGISEAERIRVAVERPRVPLFPVGGE